MEKGLAQGSTDHGGGQQRQHEESANGIRPAAAGRAPLARGNGTRTCRDVHVGLEHCLKVAARPKPAFFTRAQVPGGCYGAKMGHMKASDQGGLRLACDIVWSLDAGETITILLALLRAARIAPGVTDTLLRAGFYLLPTLHGQRVFSSAEFAFIDAGIYGLLFFVGMQLWLSRRRLGLGGAARADRRRGTRVALDAPVFVYGWAEDEPFSESTETLNVGELGGLIPLSVKVVPSQELLLTNLQTDQDVPCRVARAITREDGKTLAGLTFLQASPSFWQIEFLSKEPCAAMEPAVGLFEGARREKADPSVASPRRATSG
jgi:hypothetical protein